MPDPEPTPSPPPPLTPHLTGDDFRARLHAAADLIADYWSSLQSVDAPPVLCRLKPGDVLRAL
ncbi:MAG: hypothetical protein K2Q09_12145, partial [Phycisphaerales bacterium]|nr:hypothetical protein [Phycisphaerales bacterium]